MKNKKWLAAAAAAGLLILALYFIFRPAPGGGTYDNLIVNGDFETLDEGGMPVGWYTESYWNYGVFDTVADGSGTSVHVRNIQPDDARFAQTVSVSPGTLYHLHGFIRANASSGTGANLSVAGLNAYSECVYNSQGEWREVSLYGRTGQSQRSVTVFVRLGGYSAEASGEAFFDHITLNRVDSVPEGFAETSWYAAPAPASSPSADSDSAAGALKIILGGLAYTALFIVLSRRMMAKGQGEIKAKKGGLFALGGVLLLAFIARLTVAATVPGYDVDIGCFRGWAAQMALSGPADFYRDAGFCDYPPGYLWVLWLLGGLGHLFQTGVSEWMVKLPPILADLALCCVLYMEAKKELPEKSALALAILYAFNPFVFVTGSAWGQADALMVLLLILVVVYARRGKWRAALPLYMASVLVKPQALMFGPLGLAAFALHLTRTFRQTDKKEKNAVLRDALTGLGLAVLTGLLIALPFSLHQPWDWLLTLYGKTMSQYGYATVNACNFYFLLGKNWVNAESSLQGNFAVPLIAFALSTLPLLAVGIVRSSFTKENWQNRESRARILALALPALALGTALLILALAGGLTYASLGNCMIIYGVALMIILYILGGDIHNLALLGAGLLILLFNTGSMMHERYLFPAAALLLLAYADRKDKRILWLAVAVTLTGLINVGCALDRNIRIGGAAGHLNAPACAIQSDMAWLEYLAAAGNYLICGLTVMLCLLLCRRDAAVLAFQANETADRGLQTQSAQRTRPPIKQPPLRPLTKRDWLIMLTATLLYAVLAFTNLGSLKAPQNGWVSQDMDEEVVFDLGQERSFQMLYYGGIHQYDSDFTVSTSQDGEHWDHVYTAGMKIGDCFRWKFLSDYPLGTYPAQLSGRYVRITADHMGLTLYEVIFRDAETMDILPVSSVSASRRSVNAQALTDEQDMDAFPKNGCILKRSQEQAILDLGEEKEFQLWYYGDSYQNFTVSTSVDQSLWQDYTAPMQPGDCFQWKTLPTALSGRYVRMTANNADLTLYEVLLRDAETEEILPVQSVRTTWESNTCRALLDEQDTLEGEPGWYNSTYFDEIYHARTGYEHLHGLRTYETTHPPLGKVFISWAIAVFGMTPFGWRFAGALAGVLMLPGMYLLGQLLFRRKWGGTAAMLLMAFDLMHFTQTRIATIDSFVVLFIIWMIYFMLRWFYQDFFRMKFWKTLIPLALSGLFMGLGVASKWTGCYAGVALALIFFLGIWRRYRLVRSARKIQWRRAKASKRKRRVFRLSPASRPMPADRRAPWQLRAQKKGVRPLLITVASCLVFFVLVPALIYYVSYIPYFAYNGGVTVQKIVDAANYMLWYHSQPGFGMDHPYYSPWYQWPVIYKPMFYAASIYEPAGYESSIMAFGNPAIWWGGLAGLIGVCFLALRRHLLADRTLSPYVEKDDSRAAVLLICFFVQYLPWVLVPRGTYIYHYFPCVPFIILCALLCLDHLSHRSRKAGAAALAVFLIAAAILFIGFFPYASGMLTPIWWMDMMRWFPRIYY